MRKARLTGKSIETGTMVEFLLLEYDKTCNEWKTIVQHAKRRKPGSRYEFFDKNKNIIAEAVITKAQDEFRYIQIKNKIDNKPIDDDFFDKYGHVPLPPYIKRKDESIDSERYQTIYADKTGSAAAPTAGLHFTQEILDKLDLFGIERVFITLHVGLGTFLPVRTENIIEHKMHKETFFINEMTAKKIENAKEAGRKIIAIGTTSVRTLESAWDNNIKKIVQKEGDTSIFIYPGYKFKLVDVIFTNFHTPESTLLMLVSAFANKDIILECYTEAVKEQYRFFSYGDAMLIY